MEIEKLKFHKIDKNYLKYLHDQDIKDHGYSCVPTMNYAPWQKEKFMCGIVLRVGNHNYLAPVSSYKKQQYDNILLYDIEGRVTSSIRLNFMFPVAEGTYSIYNINKEADKKYQSVVRQELNSVNAQREKIYKQAAITYQKIIALKKKGVVVKWACDFRYLEQLCQQWIKKREN